jgi:hypothetical protein
MVVKINPADVVAIPADYNNAKARACKYEVVAEYTDNWRERVKNENDNGFDAFLYSSDGDDYHSCGDDGDDDYDSCGDEDETYGFKPSGQRFYNKRDAKGHFIKKS